MRSRTIGTLALVMSFWMLGCSNDSGSADTGQDTALNSETLSTPSECTSDFTPASGAGEVQNVKDDGGPWNRRLLLATSPDGLNWTKKNQVLANQGDAQSMVVATDGTIYVYYLTDYAPYRDQIVAAVSHDNGETWCHKTLDFTYTDGVKKGADPAMLVLSDGSFRMYFSATSPGAPAVKTRSAVSTDGLTFVQEAGVRFSRDTGPITAPSVLQIGPTTHLFWLVKGGINGHATSADAMTFVDAGTVDLGMGYFIAESGLGFEDGYRMFVFGPPKSDGHKLYFSHSKDGDSWTLDSEALLPTDDGSSLEFKGIRGATAAKLKDGTYLMVYASNIPDDS